jgi:hypothetical protein
MGSRTERSSVIGGDVGGGDVNAVARCVLTLWGLQPKPQSQSPPRHQEELKIVTNLKKKITEWLGYGGVTLGNTLLAVGKKEVQRATPVAR